MSHQVVEQLAGLSSRVDNLVANTTGDACRQLESLQERLEKLTLAAISADLQESQSGYAGALSAITSANETIGEGDAQIQQISKTIALIAKAADAVESLVKKAAAM